ncbi:MAG TPA: TA system VapC family ribonuclease toxin [Candidatus Acidoferrum sp.]|nr:TA system VapC family ribonuclease toxin [Candidatus Acidoferrum sp.]
MKESTTSFLFPDLNVWLALSYESHIHHRVAAAWFDSLLASSRLCFCRMTQIGLLRLLTTEQIMNSLEVLTQRQAWQVYDQLLEDERIVFMDEPPDLEVAFRSASQLRRAAPKDWADSYLIAFAQSAGFRLVTFDKAISRKANNVMLLSPS